VSRTNALCLQAEAALLKSVTSGGSGTKVIALGIGNGFDHAELEDIASYPPNKNVIVVQDFSSLPLIEEQLRNESCAGNLRIIETWFIGIQR